MLKPLRAFGEPNLDLIGPMPFTVRQSMLDGTAPASLHFYDKSQFLSDVDAAIPAILARFPSVPSPRSHVILGAMGGAVARVAPEATAFGHRDAPWILWVIGCWTPGEDAEPNVAWVRGIHDTAVPYGTGGVYVNALGNEGADRVRAAYRPEIHDRLVALKNEYDPTNLFRLNQNIAPAPRP